jgi:glycosyltransferase involved in cell wall biosynthesis
LDPSIAGVADEADSLTGARISRVTGSIVVPAHDEAPVIGRTLNALQDGLDLRDVEILVVANGCSDDTAEVARTLASQANVIEIAQASKAEALRTGDRAATRMPRLYVDADVSLTGTAAAATLRALATGAVAARPPAVYDTAAATWPVRSYYRARSKMASMHTHAWGAGVYGLSEQARERFSEFPDVVGDDLWIDQLLAPGELQVVDTDPVVVRTPRDSRRLLRILRRAQHGKREPGDSAPNGSTQSAALRDLRQVARSGRGGWIDAVVYAAFALAARARSSPGNLRWERDDSSRTAP